MNTIYDEKPKLLRVSLIRQRTCKSKNNVLIYISNKKSNYLDIETNKFTDDLLIDHEFFCTFVNFERTKIQRMNVTRKNIQENIYNILPIIEEAK